MRMIKRGFVFLTLLAVILAGCSVWTEKAVRQAADQIQGRNRPVAGISAEKKNTIDVLVLGDSESYNSISPVELWKEQGITSYDCGQGGQRIQETYYMLKTALKTQNPKVVLLETNALFRDPGLFKNTQLALAEPLRYYFPVFRYHNLWKTAFDEKKTTDKVYKGFVIRKGISAYSGDEYMKETKEVQEMSPFVHFYMDRIRQLCEKNGMKLLLVSAPSPKNYNYKKHNALQQYVEECNGKAGQQVDYVNLNMKVKELGIDWAVDSQDKGDHLNVYGAGKVTGYIGKYLAEKYKLPDHRGDESYVEWDRLAGEYYLELESEAEKQKKK